MFPLELANMIYYRSLELARPELCAEICARPPWRATYHTLMWAARHSCLEVIKFLASCGINVNYYHDYFLCEVAERGRLAVVKWLVERRGANVNASNGGPLCWAAAGGHLEVVKWLIAHGADLHAANDSALYWAVLRGHLPVVQWLVEHGARPRADAVAEAVRAGHSEVAQFLRARINESMYLP